MINPLRRVRRALFGAPWGERQPRCTWDLDLKRLHLRWWVYISFGVCPKLWIDPYDPPVGHWVVFSWWKVWVEWTSA